MARRNRKRNRQNAQRIRKTVIVRYVAPPHKPSRRRSTENSRPKSGRLTTTVGGKTNRKGGQTSYVNTGQKIIGHRLITDNPCKRERQRIRRAYMSFRFSMPRGKKLNNGGTGRFDNKVC